MTATILVVEDNSDNAQLMEYLLREGGYEPVVAAGGSEGIRAFEEVNPDLILLDIHMEDVNGFDVLMAIRRQADPGAPPIVAVTAAAMVGRRDQVLRAGFDGYLSKPIAPEKFVRQVESHLAPGLRAGAGAQEGAK